MLREYPAKQLLRSLNPADDTGLFCVGKDRGMSRLGARGDPRDAVQRIAPAENLQVAWFKIQGAGALTLPCNPLRRGAVPWDCPWCQAS